MPNPWDAKYRHDASIMKKPQRQLSGKTAWDCPSNIALVKYWGKKPVQQPLNPSVSFALEKSKTTLNVDFSIDPSRKNLSLDFYFEDKPGKLAFKDRFYKYLHQLFPYFPFLNHAELVIRAHNSFPHSAGIASSASSFGALALSLCSIEQIIFGALDDETEFLKKASFLSRLGSGSACRSVFGGFSLWGKARAFEGSSNELALPVNAFIHPVFQKYCDSILVIYSGEKEISSSAGHLAMEHHPYYAARILQANENTEKMLGLLKNGDERGFGILVEEEALTLHALMMTSRPSYILIKPATLEVIDRIRHFRTNSGLNICFTLDAGANIHVLYSPIIRPQVDSFIRSELIPFCEDGRIIHDEVGNGPVNLG